MAHREMSIQGTSTQVQEDEVAAALAAVRALLQEEEGTQDMVAPASVWAMAGRLEGCNREPRRTYRGMEWRAVSCFGR